MSRLDIDFAAKPRRPTRVAGLALLLAGAAALSVVSLEIEDLEQQTTVAEARLKSLTRRGAALAAKSAAGPGKDAAGAAAGEVLTRLRTPWPDLLEQLEGLADLPVVVLDLDAEAHGRSLRLAGEAKTMEDMLAFVEKLRQSRRFDEVYLEKHEPRRLGAVEVLAFTVQAAWPQARDAAP